MFPADWLAKDHYSIFCREIITKVQDKPLRLRYDSSDPSSKLETINIAEE